MLPLPTSREWVGNFGFEKTINKLDCGSYRHPKFPNLSVTIKNGLANEIITQTGDREWKTVADKIYYVHLFQLKWFMITRKDLILNLIK